jgi:SAM-dependent methyltransferase
MHPAEFEEMVNLEDGHWWFRGKQLLVASLLARSGLGPAARLLDVGCGTGGLLQQLRLCGQVVGVDSAQLALAYCRARGLSVARTTASSLPFAGGTFDGCVMLDVLEHLDDELPVLHEVRRILRPGGVVVASVPAFGALWSQHDETFQHRRRYLRAALVAVVSRAGLRVEWSSYTNFGIFAPALAWRTLRRWTGVAPTVRTDFFRLPAPVNGLLVGLYRCEAAFLRRGRLPFGVSVACVARNV